MNNKARFGDPVWEKLFQKGWGKYPPEEVVRFYFRLKNECSSPPRVPRCVVLGDKS